MMESIYRIKLTIDVQVENYDVANNIADRVYAVVEETLGSIGATHRVRLTEAQRQAAATLRAAPATREPRL